VGCLSEIWFPLRKEKKLHCTLQEAYESVTRLGSLSDAISSNSTRLMMRLFESRTSVIAGGFDKTQTFLKQICSVTLHWPANFIKLGMKVMTLEGCTFTTFLLLKMLSCQELYNLYSSPNMNRRGV
jgi:hypothetical protein